MKLSAALLVGLLAGCSLGAEREPVRAAASPGDGPIRTSPQVQESYERFLGKTYPMVFALSADGRSAFYYFCFTPGDCDEDRARADSLSGCEDNSNGIPCRIYYEAPDGVVWDGPPVIGLDEATETKTLQPIEVEELAPKTE